MASRGALVSVLWWACTAQATVPYGPLRLDPPPGWTTSWRDDGWHFSATAATGAEGVLRGPYKPAGDFADWFAETVKAAQDDALHQGQPVSFQTAGGLRAVRQTWSYLWSAIFVGGTIDRTDLAFLKDGRAWHLHVATGRQDEEHQAALRAVLAMLDTVSFGVDAPRRDGQVGDVSFAAPAGWQRCDRDGRAVLMPTDLKNGDLVEAWILPSQAIDGDLAAWLTELAASDRGGESDVAPVPTTTAEVAPVDGPVDLAWQTTAADGQPRLRYYHAVRRGGQVLVYGLTTNGMPLWDRYGEVLGPLQRSLAVVTAG